MFQDLPRYQEYRVGGAWVNDLPAHWRWDPARTIFRERKETGFFEEPLLSVTIGRGVISQADLIAATSKKDSSNADKSKYKLVTPGDLVYNKMRAWQGAAGLSRHRGIVSPAYIVMTPRKGKVAYFHHLVRTPIFAKEAERWSYGITSDQWSLRPEHFKMIRFPVPPLDEQAGIVKYLAHASTRIDEAIAGKRRLIGLLQEETAVVLARVIGDVGGDGLRLKHVAQIQTGITLGKDYGNQELREFPYLRVANVQMGHVDTSDIATVLVPASAVANSTLRAGDVLLTEGGDIDKLGRGTVWDGSVPNCLHQNHVFAVRCGNQLRPHFLAAWLATPRARHYFYRTAKKTTNLASTNSTTVRELPITVPSLDVQHSALHELASRWAPFELAIRRTVEEIDLLQEFRTRLVADVATGQVDIREVADSLPDIDLRASWSESGDAEVLEPADFDDIVEASEV